MRTARILVVAGALLLAACGDDGGTSNENLGIPDATGSPGVTVQTDHGAGEGGHGAAEEACTMATAKQTITASDTHFDHHCLTGPADTAFQITFVNEDTAAYNLAIFRSHTDVEPLFRGDLVPGPATVTYDVPPLAAGEYAFHSEAATDDLGHGTLIIE